MSYINVHDAKTNLSKLIEAIESGTEREITIARNGRPAARLVPIERKRTKLLGIAKGKYVIPDDISGLDAEIERLFNGEEP